MVKMDLKELQDYLGITDNDNYMYKADVRRTFWNTLQYLN